MIYAYMYKYLFMHHHTLYSAESGVAAILCIIYFSQN